MSFLFANNSQQAIVSPHFLYRGENQMRSHPDYHAHFLLLELGFRSIQWLRAMDYEGLLKEDSKQSHHTEDVDVCVCVLSVLQYRIRLYFSNLSPNRKLGNQSERQRLAQSHTDSGGAGKANSLQ